MKALRTIALLVMGLGLLYGTTSCVVYTKHDNPGQHKGWYKNSNNPHHHHSKNPGKSEDKHNNGDKYNK